MGYDTACVAGNVGIGNLPPEDVKLFVQDTLDTPNSMGVQVNTSATAANTFGISATIESIVAEATQITGVHGRAINGKAPIGGLFEAVGEGEFLTQPAVGVLGHATSFGPTGSSNDNNAIGVYGLGESSIDCDRPIGVYGQAINSTGCTNGIAGYFAGAIVEGWPAITLSDESIKTDVIEIENATDLLLQIAPKSYNFIPNESVPSAYSSEMNYGFLAQEVQEVLPNVVQSVPAPIYRNEEGEIVSTGEELMGIQYGQFIPILVAGFQEQQSQIEARDAEIADLQQGLADQNELMMQMMDQMELMQQQINGCCNGDALPKNFGSDDDAAPDANPKEQNELYQNVPNPFRGQTTIRYTLEQGGRAMLNIHDSNGREITQLENSEQVAGTYSYVWDATGLPAGTYHYSLVVDGELLVKRAIKLQD